VYRGNVSLFLRASVGEKSGVTEPLAHCPDASPAGSEYATSELKVPQLGHFPHHLEKTSPQCSHKNWSVVFLDIQKGKGKKEKWAKK
jgi:hypothetical protein